MSSARKVSVPHAFAENVFNNVPAVLEIGVKSKKRVVYDEIPDKAFRSFAVTINAAANLNQAACSAAFAEGGGKGEIHASLHATRSDENPVQVEVSS